MGQQTSQLISYSLESPKPSGLPCGFEIMSRQLSRSQFCKSFKASQAQSQALFLAKVIQIPANLEISGYVAILRSQQLSMQNLKYALPFSYVHNGNQQITIFRPLAAQVLHFSYRRNKYFMAYQMIRALNEMHERGIAHGNVKLSNFAVTEQDEVFITDAMICKPHYVEDELQLQFYFSVSDVSRISASAAYFSCCSMETDRYELGLAIYELFYGDLSIKAVIHNSFQFKEIFDAADHGTVSINAVIRRLLNYERVDEKDMFSNQTLIQLSRLRLYFPGSFYSDLYFLLSVGQRYLYSRCQEGLLYICSHIVSRIYDAQILADVEMSVLSFMLDCFEIGDQQGKQYLLRLSFILLEKLQLCYKSNYLLYFTALLDKIQHLDSECYYFPFLVMCRFFVSTGLYKDIMLLLQSLRQDRYVDLLQDKSKLSTQQNLSKIDGFYLINCFSRMYGKMTQFAWDDKNLLRIAEDVLIQHPYSFFEQTIYMCHDKIEQTGANYLFGALLQGMETFSANNQFIISRIIILLNNKPNDIITTFLRCSAVSQQYLMSVEQLIDTQCSSQDLNIEVSELFLHRISGQFYGRQKLLLRFAQYIAERISLVFFYRNEMTTSVRRRTIQLFCQVIKQIVDEDELNGTLRVNCMIRRVFGERLRHQLYVLIKQNCDVDLGAQEKVSTKIRYLLDEITGAAAEYHIYLDFDCFDAEHIRFRSLLPEQLKNSQYMEALMLRALNKSQRFYADCQQFIKAVPFIAPNYEAFKIAFAKSTRLGATIEEKRDSYINLLEYLQCNELFPFYCQEQITDNSLLLQLLYSESQRFLNELGNPLLAGYFFNRYINFIACFRYKPLSYAEMDEQLAKLRRANKKQEKPPRSSSNANLLFCDQMYINIQTYLTQAVAPLRDVPVNILQQEEYVRYPYEPVSWTYYRYLIENEVLQHYMFKQLMQKGQINILPVLYALQHSLQAYWNLGADTALRYVEVDGNLIYCLTESNILHIFRPQEATIAQDLMRFIVSTRGILNMKIFEHGASYRFRSTNYQQIKKDFYCWAAIAYFSVQQLMFRQLCDTPLVSLPFPFEIRYFQPMGDQIAFLTDCNIFTLRMDMANIQLAFSDAFTYQPRTADCYQFALCGAKYAKFNLFLSQTEAQSQLAVASTPAQVQVLRNQLIARYTDSRTRDLEQFAQATDNYASHAEDFRAYVINSEYIAGRLKQHQQLAQLARFQCFALGSSMPARALCFAYRRDVCYVISQHHVRAFCSRVLLRQTKFAEKISSAHFSDSGIFLLAQSIVIVVNYELSVVRTLSVSADVAYVHNFEMKQLQQYAAVCDVHTESRFLAVFTEHQVSIFSAQFEEFITLCAEGNAPTAFLALKTHLLFGFAHGVIVQLDFAKDVLNCCLLEPSTIDCDNAALLLSERQLQPRRAADVTISGRSVQVKMREPANGAAIVKIAPARSGAGSIYSVASDGSIRLWK